MMNIEKSTAIEHMRRALDILDSMPEHRAACYLQYAIELFEADEDGAQDAVIDCRPAPVIGA